MTTGGSRGFSTVSSAWLRKRVVLLIAIPRRHVPIPCSMLGESAASPRVRFNPGWEMDLRKEHGHRRRRRHSGFLRELRRATRSWSFTPDSDICRVREAGCLKETFDVATNHYPAFVVGRRRRLLWVFPAVFVDPLRSG
jgi:hypothetical protein